MTSLVPAGLSARQYGAKIAWARRRAKYGENGLTPLGKEKLSRLWGRMAHWSSKKTHCKQGHPFSKTNTKLMPGKKPGTFRRRCIACDSQRNRKRPRWAMIGNARVCIFAHDKFYERSVHRLRKLRSAAHPDCGGTTKKFQAAWTTLKEFIDLEVQWYKQFNLAPPRLKESRVSINRRSRLKKAV